MDRLEGIQKVFQRNCCANCVIFRRNYYPSNQEQQPSNWQADHYGPFYAMSPEDQAYAAPLHHQRAMRQMSDHQDYSPHVSESSDGSYRGVLLNRARSPLMEQSPRFPEPVRNTLIASPETSDHVLGRKYSANSLSSDSDPPLPSIQDTILFPSTGQVGFRRSNLWMQNDSASVDDDLASYHSGYSPQACVYYSRDPSYQLPYRTDSPHQNSYRVDSPHQHLYCMDSQDNSHIFPEHFYTSSTDPFYIDGSHGSFSDDRHNYEHDNPFCYSDYLPSLGMSDEGLLGHSHIEDPWRSSADPVYVRDTNTLSEDPLSYHPSQINTYQSSRSAYSNPSRMPTVTEPYRPKSGYSNHIRSQDKESFPRMVLPSKEGTDIIVRSSHESGRRSSQSKNRRNNEINGTLLKEKLEYAVQLKKQGEIDQARVLMEGLWKEAPSSIPVILELIRLNTDSGAFFEARALIQEVLKTRSDDDLLLERSLRVEERMGNLNGILQVVNSLMHSRKYRNVKTVVDACMTVAKLGDIPHAQQIFQYLIENDHCKQGNLILNYILFVYRSVSVERAYELLHTYTGSCYKHGPLWFFSFVAFEHRMMLAWNAKSMSERIQPQELLCAYRDSLKAISTELRWKVFYMATQMLLRTVSHLRLIAFKKVISQNVCNR